jgi:hypothetical protein
VVSDELKYELDSHWDDPAWVERHYARQAEEEREIQAAIERAQQEELMRIPANRYRRDGEVELDENGKPYDYGFGEDDDEEQDDWWRR